MEFLLILALLLILDVAAWYWGFDSTELRRSDTMRSGIIKSDQQDW
ncbi:MAG: hypothetical protein NVS4B9_31530 [Ktedonobacteraceae bacterium]